MYLAHHRNRAFTPHPGKTVGLRVKLGPTDPPSVFTDTYQMNLLAGQPAQQAQIPVCAKALLNVTRHHKLAFHFIKASLPAQYLERYFADHRFRLTDTFTLPRPIARALDLRADLYFLSPGEYRVVDLGDHLTVVIPLHSHQLLSPAIAV